MKIIAALMLLCCLFNPVLAVAQISDDLIDEAMEYGANNTKVSFDKFAFSWLAYEEKAAQLNEQAERAYIYTPYLLVASNARDKALIGKQTVFADSKKFLTDFNGYLVFSVALLGSKPDFLGTATAFIKQGDKLTRSVQCSIAQNIEKSENSSSEYNAQIYCYFPVGSISMNSPVQLVISTADKRLHKFYFDLAKTK